MHNRFCLLQLLVVAKMSYVCYSHGKLTKPTPRDGISAGRAGLDQNNPVSFEPGCTKENSCDAFVCREAAPNPNVLVTNVVAGQTLTLAWSFAALHVGDCSVYISYDVQLARSQQKYVKIANIPDCKSYTTWTITVPDSLPAGRAILRWDWVALHIWPKTENFVQCADIDIQSASSLTPGGLDSFSITNPPIYPDDGNDGVGFRNAFGTGAQDMTGPSCVDDSINECWLTAAGTLRNTDSRRGSGAPSPVNQFPVPAPPSSQPSPTITPVPRATPAPATQPSPTIAPVPEATPAPASGQCISSGPEYYAAACASLAATCEQHSFCRRVSAEAPSGTPPPSGACVSNDPNIDYSSACQALEATCELHDFCKRASSLTQSATPHKRHLRRPSHHVLLQEGSAMLPSVRVDGDDGLELVRHSESADSAAPAISRSEL